MGRLKIGALPDDKPVKVALELPASVHRDLLNYAAALAHESGQPVNDLVKLIAPMLVRFMVSDRGFAKWRRQTRSATGEE